MSIFSSSLLAIAILGGSANAQVAFAAASIPVDKIELKRRTMDVLVALAAKYRVVIGVQGILIGDDSQVVSISLSSGTLKDVLDSIVSQDPRFEWQQGADGSIHFSIRNAALPLAAITVPSFDVENPRRMETVELLSRIPEVRTWLQQHDCSMSEMIAGHLPNDWGHFSVHVRDGSLSSVLDKIAAGSNTYFWSAIQYSTKPCAINVSP
jgi:hypothetical protein